MNLGYTSKKPVFIELDQVDKDYQLIDPVFQIEKIVDSTNSNGVIGIVQKGISNIKRPAKFKNSISFEFNEFINKRYYHNPYAKKIIMSISKISVSENSKAFNESGQVILSIQYFYQRKLYHSDMLVKSNTTITDVTHSHSKSLSILLETSLANLSEKIRNERDL